MAAGGAARAPHQVLHNLTRRGPEHELLPGRAARGMPVMAYSPVEQGRRLASKRLRELAAGLGVTPAQLALAWVLHQGERLAVPKAGRVAYGQENRAAAELQLSAEDRAALGGAFPRPGRTGPLEMPCGRKVNFCAERTAEGYIAHVEPS